MDSLHWFVVLVIGLLIGWLFAWLLDYIIWRERRECSDYEKGLKAEVGTLRSKNSTLSADVGKLNKRVSRVGDLEAQIASHKADHKGLLADFDAQSSKLKKANISLNSSRKELGSFKESSARASDIDGQLKKSTTAYARLKADFEARGAELSGAKARLSDKDVEIGKLNGQVKEFQGGFKKLGLGAAGGAVTAAGLFTALRGRFTDNDDAQSASVGFKADLDSKSVEIKRLSAELETVRGDLKSRDHDLGTFRAQAGKADASAADVTRLSTELKTSSDEISRLKLELSGHQADMQKIQADFEPTLALVGDIDVMRAQLEQRDLEIKKLHGQVEGFKGGLNADLDTKSAEITRLSAQLKTAHGDIKSRDHDLGTLRAQAGKADAHSADMTRLTAELETSSAEVSRLKLELSNRRADMQKMQSDFEPTLALVGDIDVMRAQIEQRDLEIGEMRGLLESREQELGDLTYELDDKDGKWASLGLMAGGAAGGGLLARLHGMRSEVEVKNTQLTTHTTEIHRLNTRIAELERAPAPVAGPDDLTRIYQIGPKISSILNQGGITTFSGLAETDPEHVGSILDAQPGDRYRFATPEFRVMWQEQARAASVKDWVLFDEIPKRYNFTSSAKSTKTRKVTKTVVTKTVKAAKPDDLTRIHGIGPKISSVLNRRGISTFAELAAADPEYVGRILDDEPGDKYRLATLEYRGMWREQAHAAVATDWVLFDEIPKKYNFTTTTLVTEVVKTEVIPAKPAKPAKPDDLTRIHGIGPKIASILNEDGIMSFAQLSETDPDLIGELLDRQPGDKFRLATPEVRTSWRAQALAAVAEDWTQFERLAQKFKKLTRKQE